MWGAFEHEWAQNEVLKQYAAVAAASETLDGNSRIFLLTRIYAKSIWANQYYSFGASEFWFGSYFVKYQWWKCTRIKFREITAIYAISDTPLVIGKFLAPKIWQKIIKFKIQSFQNWQFLTLQNPWYWFQVKSEPQTNYEMSTLCVAHCEVTFQEGQWNQTQNSIFNQLYSILLG